MAKKNSIITLPNPSLRTPSRKVGLIDDSILELARRMEVESIEWENGRDHEVTVALAAVQIDELWRVVVIREDFDNRDNKTFITLINPEITKYEGEIVEDFEGCLSVSDYYAKVPRYTKVRVTARSIDGRELRFSADGFLARTLQHEIDHTKGITIVDRVTDKENGFKKLNSKGKFDEVDYQEVKKTGILLDD